MTAPLLAQVEVEIPLGVQPGDTFLVEVAGASEAQQRAQMQMSQGSQGSGHSSGYASSTGVLGDASQVLGMSAISAPSFGNDGAPPLSPEEMQQLSFGLGGSDLDSSLASLVSASPFENTSAGRALLAHDGSMGLHTVFEYAEGGATYTLSHHLFWVARHLVSPMSCICMQMFAV